MAASALLQMITVIYTFRIPAHREESFSKKDKRITMVQLEIVFGTVFS